MWSVLDELNDSIFAPIELGLIAANDAIDSCDLREQQRKERQSNDLRHHCEDDLGIGAGPGRSGHTVPRRRTLEDGRTLRAHMATRQRSARQANREALQSASGCFAHPLSP